MVQNRNPAFAVKRDLGDRCGGAALVCGSMKVPGNSKSFGLTRWLILSFPFLEFSTPWNLKIYLLGTWYNRLYWHSYCANSLNVR